MEALGAAPCEYAFLSLGSLARRECCPYSDLEFAILLGKPLDVSQTEQQIRNYFKKIVELIELKVISLGETHKVEGLTTNVPQRFPKGFQFDEGGNYPFSAKDVDGNNHEFIGTVKQLSNRIKVFGADGLAGDIIAANTLQEAQYMFGSRRLAQEYRKQVKTILEAADSQDPTMRYGQRLSFHLLSDHLNDFKLNLTKQSSYFDVKTEVLRLPIFFVNTLALYFAVDDSNSQERIDVLCGRTIITPTVACAFEEIIHYGLELRIRAHFHSKQETDKVDLQPKHDDPQTGLILTKAEQTTFWTLYDQKLRKMRGCAEEFLNLIGKQQQQRSRIATVPDNQIRNNDAFRQISSVEKATQFVDLHRETGNNEKVVRYNEYACQLDPGNQQWKTYLEQSQEHQKQENHAAQPLLLSQLN